ncbi:MAG: hypothetical protein K9L62_10980 [Vallitaleaceae bacterium]|nr:hypothetical protein [Vallitaleaceae bacterium]
MGDIIIAAPHPDDEIIGCYEVLMKEKNPIIIYSADVDAGRRETVLKLKDEINCKLQLFQMTIPQTFLTKENIFYLPDPIYEFHPKHREWGFLGENLARNGFNVIFYNTTMTAPYIHECAKPDKKEELLNKIYHDQKSLWEYEKKYVLFEGYNKWIF